VGNKLDLNVDRKLRIPLFAMFVASVIGNVHKALSGRLVLLKAATCIWRQSSGSKEDNLKGPF
jgi:hypothetical protein